MNQLFHQMAIQCKLLIVIMLLPVTMLAQQTMTVNMAPIDGIDITPDNIFNFQIISTLGASKNTLIKGAIHYRNLDLSLSYSFHYRIQPGANQLSADMVNPQWQFSSSALRELFFNYKKLPAGTYEYCVTIYPDGGSSDMGSNNTNQCLYHQSDETFLINLVNPEDKAIINTYNPPLTWVANCPFASELTYRVRVAEIKPGQNTQTAVSSNQPMYDERNIPQNTIIYPAYAKPLIANQPYAWTVDAYYKGILLGQAEAWQFTIKADTVPIAPPISRSYIDIKRENGTQQLYAAGQLKLKYVCNDRPLDSLTLHLYNDDNKEVKINTRSLNAVYGDNRYILDLTTIANLKDNNKYLLEIQTQGGKTYKLPFVYYNPNFH